MSEENHTTDEHERLISKKATFHKNCAVHISLKNNRGWENGTIIEVRGDHLILKLNKFGREKHGIDSIPFFFLEIKDIREYAREVM